VDGERQWVTGENGTPVCDWWIFKDKPSRRLGFLWG